MKKLVSTRVKINYLKKIKHTDKTIYSQLMALTRTEILTLLWRSTFFPGNRSIQIINYLLGNWFPHNQTNKKKHSLKGITGFKNQPLIKERIPSTQRQS